MPQIDVMDSTWIAARPEVIAPIVANPANWSRWWPGLALTVHERRGPKGVRWTVSGDAGLAGTAEVWLQPMSDGVVAHFFLRLDPAPGRTLPARRALRVARDYRRRTKRAFWELADRADPHRAVRATSDVLRSEHQQMSGAAAPVAGDVPGSV